MRHNGKQINWVCDDCGEKYGDMPEGHVYTWHYGHCDVCDKDNVPVTEPRDYKYLPRLSKEKHDERSTDWHGATREKFA